MKNNITNLNRLLIFSITILSSILCQASNSYKIGIISDLHYLSEQLMDNEEAVNRYISSSARNIKEVPLILDQVINDYINNQIDILLIPGDLTKDGEKQSHLDLVKKLKPLQDKGVRIFVIPGNHDINIPNAKSYQKEKTILTESITSNEFQEIYSELGYNNAIIKDTASLSYVSKIDNKIWLLAIDTSLYNEYTTSSLSAGRISLSTENWIIRILEEAKKKNITIISMMHHGLVEHFQYQSTFFPQYLVDDWYRLASLFADNGVKTVFTGHFHANDIVEFVSINGNKIYDIETGSLASYPFPYRFANLSTEGIQITTKNITSTATNPNLTEESKSQLQALAKYLAEQKIRNKKPDLAFSLREKIADLASKIFILHVAGDEVLSNSIKQQIEEIAIELDIPIDTSLDIFQLDLPPADNNTQITF